MIFSFLAYFLHERNTNSATSAANNAAPNTNVVPRAVPSGVPGAAPNVVSSVIPTATISSPQGAAYKNGTYTGPQVDAYYGLVQVQVIIQNGKIANVQFLDYPHDLRTSQEINSQVMPWLTQEAIQAQSANVDIISGATLTSEAFASSLQSALRSAKN